MRSQTQIELRLEDIEGWIKTAKEMGIKVANLETAQVVLKWTLEKSG